VWEVEDSPLLEAVARERLLETLQAGEDLAALVTRLWARQPRSWNLIPGMGKRFFSSP
jgi:hypothetical protein